MSCRDLSPAESLLIAERRTLLASAALQLEAEQPQFKIYRRLKAPSYRREVPPIFEVVVVFRWPGFVVVTERHSGQLIARSKPGEPFELDEQACTLPSAGAQLAATD